VKKVCLETIIAEKLKAEKTNNVTGFMTDDEEDEEVPAGEGWLSPPMVRRDTSRVAHYSHRVSAATGPGERHGETTSPVH
jgi:hypothetical protein